MSIVGTRPPLISETNLYEPRHKVTVIIILARMKLRWNYRFVLIGAVDGRIRPHIVMKKAELY